MTFEDQQKSRAQKKKQDSCAQKTNIIVPEKPIISLCKRQPPVVSESLHLVAPSELNPCCGAFMRCAVQAPPRENLVFAATAPSLGRLPGGSCAWGGMLLPPATKKRASIAETRN